MIPNPPIGSGHWNPSTDTGLSMMSQYGQTHTLIISGDQYQGTYWADELKLSRSCVIDSVYQLQGIRFPVVILCGTPQERYDWQHIREALYYIRAQIIDLTHVENRIRSLYARLQDAESKATAPRSKTLKQVSGRKFR